MRKEAIQEIKNQIEMYRVQYNLSHLLGADRKLINNLKKKDKEKIKIYKYILSELEG